MTQLTPQNTEENPTSLATLLNFPLLSVEEQAFAVAYVSESYSLLQAASAIKVSPAKCQKMLQKVTIRSAITEIQNTLGDLDFLNERWVKEQLLRLYPKLIGEEDIPMIDNTGAEFHAKKFHAEAALKVLEYISPKQQAAKANSGVNIQVNIDLGAMGIGTVKVVDNG